jgi:monothiol glutaredoxin
MRRHTQRIFPNEIFQDEKESTDPVCGCWTLWCLSEYTLSMLQTRSFFGRAAVKTALRGGFGTNVRQASGAVQQLLHLPSTLSSSALPLVQRFGRTTTAVISGTSSAIHRYQSSSTKDHDDSTTHGDFAPRKKVAAPADTQAALAMIDEHVKNNPVMLYMKGNPSQPMCGFSAKVVGILQKEEIDFSSVNVLDYASIREGVKQYSQWPTIPQLYVNAEFIGGCDIVTAMHESGELAELLKTVPKAASD